MARTRSKTSTASLPRQKPPSPPVNRSGRSREGRQSLDFGFDFGSSFWLLWALAAILRIATFTRNAVWYDELMMWQRAQSPFSELFNTTIHWLHAILIRIGLAVSDGAVGLRLFPLLFGIAAFPFVYATGQLLAKRAGAIAFGLLFAVSQYHIFYSQDGNYYSEMMFYTIVAVYLTTSGLINHRFWLIALSLIPHLLSFLTHPFSGLFFALMVLAIVFVFLLDAAFRKRILYALCFWRRPKATIIAQAIGLVVFCLILVGLHAFLKQHYGADALALISRMSREAMQGVRFGATSWNVELNPYFFLRTLREIGPSYIHDNVYAQTISLLFILFWLLGFIFLIQKRSWPALVFYIPIIGTYAFLFNFDPGRFFHIRYASYLCPLYLAGIALGGLWVGNLIRSENAAGERQLPKSLWPVVILAILTLPTLTAYYFRDGANWKKLARYLQPRLKSNSALIYYNEREGMQAEFYAKRYDLPRESLFPARNTGERQHEIALSSVKQTVVSRPDSWFFTSWLEPTWNSGDARLLVSPIVSDWVRQNFQKVLDAPSAEEVNPIPLYRDDLRKKSADDPPVQSAVLYRWQYPHRYLYAPNSLTIDLTKAPKPLEEGIEPRKISLLDTKTGQNFQSWTFPLLVETTGKYRLIVSGQETLPASGTLTIDWGNGTVQEFKDDQSYAALAHSGAHVDLRAGLHQRVSVRWQTQAGERFVPLNLRSLRIFPAWEAGFSVPALNFAYIPPGDTEAKRIAGTTHLKVRGCRLVRYLVSVAEAGRHQLMVKAGRSISAPIAVEVWLDDKLEGVLPFMSAKPGDWEEAGFPLELPAGEHKLDFLFLQNLHDGDDESNRKEFLFKSFSLKRAEPEAKITDNRFAVSNLLFQPPGYLQQGFEILEPYSTVLPGPPENPYWAEDPQSILQNGLVVIEPGEETHSPVVRLNGTPQFARPVNFRTTLFEVAPGELLHFSFRIRTDNLYTHNANAQVWYFDRSINLASPLRKDWVNIEHQSGTTPWERWSYFDRAPEGTVFALVTFSIFTQGNPEWKQAGSAFYEDFKWSVAPEPLVAE